VYPPVDTIFYRPAEQSAADPAFLIVSALVPYKRIDVAIEACRRIGAGLTIVGRGPEEHRLRSLAGENVRFLGWRTDDEVRALYQRAAAVLLPGVEDFGMVPVEAQACGTPVVAIGSGGACETVVHGVTGILAEGDSPDGFAAALDQCRRTSFDRSSIRSNAERFSRERFIREFPAVVADAARPSAAISAGRRS
jgi:glycosyltransferase involved in cell wall biosynthesis